MFIDNPSVPVQVEVAIDLLYAIRQKSAPMDSVRALLQPKGLQDLTASSNQASNQLNAAKELRLVALDEHNHLRLTYSIRDGKPSAREAIVKAFDEVVLSSAKVEPWFGRFYGFVIALDEGWIPSDSAGRKDLCTRFNDSLMAHIERANPLNDTKLGNYMRWYTYSGLGWRDPAKRFIPDPTERLWRALPKIFGKVKRLEAAEFMAMLSAACPELDGGALFMDVAGEFTVDDRECTRALAAALRNLHDHGVIRLECPKDSAGWSLARSGSYRDEEHLQSDKFDRVVLLRN